MPKIDLTFRPRQDADTAALYSAFLRGLRESPYTFGTPSPVFFAVARRCFDRIFAEWTITVAVPAGSDTEIAGFIAHRGPVVGWLYTAHPYRRMGVATALLVAAGFSRARDFDVIFATPNRLRLFREKGWRPRFTPFRCWELTETAVAA